MFNPKTQVTPIMYYNIIMLKKRVKSLNNYHVI